jgi:putative aldouronate transport system permease protein
VVHYQICSGVTNKIESAIGMSMATTFVITISSSLAWIINHWILVPFDLEYLQLLSFIMLCGIVRVLLSVTGPVNGLLHTSINFMTLPEAFRPIYIISGIWQGAGWASIMYTASLSNASKDLKEAAMIDGANLIQQIMTVEWPAIKDMVVIQFILQAGNIMSIGFEKAYALQTDLNLNTAEIIATYVYKKGLLDGDYSFSTAVGLFNTIVNVILLIAVNKVVAKMNDGKGL